MRTVTITRAIRVAAPPTAVWQVLATPRRQPDLDPRVRLTGEWGEPGTLGSSYELTVRGRPPMLLRVTDAEVGQRHTVSVEWNGRIHGSQDARLRPDGSGCVLSYTFSLEVPLVLATVQRVYGSKQLTRWLDTVARESVQSDGQAHS